MGILVGRGNRGYPGTASGCPPAFAGSQTSEERPKKESRQTDKKSKMTKMRRRLKVRRDCGLRRIVSLRNDGAPETVREEAQNLCRSQELGFDRPRRFALTPCTSWLQSPVVVSCRTLSPRVIAPWQLVRILKTTAGPDRPVVRRVGPPESCISRFRPR